MKTFKFKANFLVPTSDFKESELKELQVKTTIPLEGALSGEVEYTVVIPNYIFDALADTEEKFSTKYDPNNREIFGHFSNRSLTRKFKKTQTSTMLSSLQDMFNELTRILNEKHSIETATMTKKIFIQFNHSVQHTTNNWCGSYRGQKINQTFNYFIGYETYTTRWNHMNQSGPNKKYVTRIEYHSPNSSTRKMDTGFEEDPDRLLPLNAHGQTAEDMEKKFTIIDWTQERQDFCEKIKQTFITINNDLSEFLMNLDNNKMDMLIAGKSNFKLLE